MLPCTYDVTEKPFRLLFNRQTGGWVLRWTENVTIAIGQGNCVDGIKYETSVYMSWAGMSRGFGCMRSGMK